MTRTTNETRRTNNWLLTLFVALLASPTANAQSITQAMSGLDNPRHLAFGPEGALYVAEAGRGGAGPCSVIRGALQCAGSSGAVSRLWNGTQSRIVTGLRPNSDEIFTVTLMKVAQ